MSLVPSLLQAIVRVDGEALVMHVGEKPYVVSPSGPVDLAAKGLTLDAVTGIVGQLLPPASMKVLDDVGAVQFELAPLDQFPGDRFTVTAARGGDDVWAEVRRRQVVEDQAQGAAPFDVSAAEPKRLDDETADPPGVPREDQFWPEPAQADVPMARVDAAEEPEQDASVPEDEPVVEWTFDPAPDRAREADSLWAPVLPALGAACDTSSADAFSSLEVAEGHVLSTEVPVSAAVSITPSAAAPLIESEGPIAEPVLSVLELPAVEPPGAGGRSVLVTSTSVVPTPMPSHVPNDRPSPFGAASPAALNHESAASSTQASADRVSFPAVASVPQPAVVLSIDRSGARLDTAWPSADPGGGALERMLRLAASRGATALYLSSNARPAARIDGEIQNLEGLPTFGVSEVEATLLAVLPERHASALRAGQPSEWMWDLAEVGRVRCSIFNDHRGPGAVCRVVTARAIGAEQLGLSREVQALSAEAEGLVVVSGPRGAGKSTLIASLVDLINRSRRDYVIAFEREINVVHDRQAAFVSQREIRGSADDLAGAARAALREDPDVLVFDELSSASLMDVAFDAVQSGRLVIAGVRAPHLSGAIDRIVEMHATERRREVLSSLVQGLRAVVTQVLVKKSTGGRAPAREVLFNSPLVASVLAEGKTGQLPMAIEGGRRLGMVPLNDALATLVQSGGVDVREAYRHAIDRAGLLDVLKRQGVDTSFVERLA
jgi:twitching motility protein PilT